MLFVDIETTGFSREWDTIIQLAAVLYDTEEKKELAVFNEYIKPIKSIPAKITEITGIDDYTVRNARNEKSVIGDFLEWVFFLGAEAVGGHNYDAFDGGFISTKAEKYGFKMYALKTFDTLKIARALKLPVLNNKQPTLAEYYGIAYKAHSALDDVRANIQIYIKMVKQPETATKRAAAGF
jgi:DNA polymerase III alpha subunit (gram-positive type)